MKLIGNAGDSILEIAFPEHTNIRSRKVVSRSRARPTGKYPSWKMGRMIQWESHNELNAFRLLDANPAVLAYHEQPLTIIFNLDGETHIHYPDVLVQWRSYRELWEIKPIKEASHPDCVARSRFLETSLPEQGFAYRIVHAEELAKEPRLSNALVLLKHGRAPVSELTRERVRLLLLQAQHITWGALLNGDLGSATRSVLCRLTLEGILSFDIEKPLTASTQFVMMQS